MLTHSFGLLRYRRLLIAQGLHSFAETFERVFALVNLLIDILQRHDDSIEFLPCLSNGGLITPGSLYCVQLSLPNLKRLFSKCFRL